MTYSYLCLGRDANGIRELDGLLKVPTDEKQEENIDRANAQAMRQLMEGMGSVMPPVPKPPVRRS